MEEQDWDKINARKRKDILWCAAWNQAATIYQGVANNQEYKDKLLIDLSEKIETLAKHIFSRMYAPYAKELPEEEWFEEGKPVVNKVPEKQVKVREFKGEPANIDKEINFPF